jgi:hypothetical protein
MSNIVINNSVDVVELHSNTDLTLESNTQIKFSTHNILINYIPFNEYIHKVVFNTDITTITLSDSSSVHSWENAVDIDTITNKINLTDNTSELIVDELHCSGISAATHSYVNNKYHYINLSATDNIYIKNNTNSSNIVYNKIDDVMYSFSNYIYKIVNSPASHTTDSLSPESITINSINRTDISSLGSYIGKRIVTSNISTSNVFVHPGNEPILEFDSQTAVNFFTNVYSNPGDVNAGLKIHFGDITLDELVKSQLDERGLITIGATMTSGQDIGMELTTLTHTKGYDFIYDIVFNLYLHDVTLPYPDNMLSSPIIDSISHSSIALATISFPFGIHYFTGLSPGQFYTVFGTLTNTRTGTAVENIEVTGGQNIATIKNIYDISVTVINEATIGIQFKGHDTVVASWSASGKRIKFSVSVNGYSGEINSGLTQDLSQISFDTSLKTFNLSVSSIVGYGNGGILRVSGSFQTNAKTINIISNHVEGGTFEMSQSVQMTLFTFVAPRHPPSLSINYVDKRLTWNHTNNPVDRLKTIYFELYKGSTKEYDGINKLFGIGTSSVGSWTVKAKNAYGQLSGVSNSLDIITPSFDVGSITSIGNKTFNIGISNVNTNGTYTLSGTNINTSSSSSIITSILIPGTYTFRVNLTDQLGLVASRNTSSLEINNPSLNINSFTVSVTGNSFSFNILSFSGNASGYTVYVTLKNGGTVIDSYSLNTTTGSKTRSKSGLSYDTTYTLYAYIQDGWGFTSSNATSYGTSSETSRAPSGTLTIGTITFNGTNTFDFSGISKSGWVSGLPTETYFLYKTTNTNLKNLSGTLPSSTTYSYSTPVTAGIYTFYIRAENIRGEFSGTSKSTTLTAPGSISLLGGDIDTNKTRDSITVYYGLDSDFSFSLTNFKIEYKESSSSSWISHYNSSSLPLSGSQTITGLNVFTDYDIKITRTNSSYVQYSEYPYKTKDYIYPVSPSFNITNINDNLTKDSISVYWINNADNDASTVSYKLEYREASISTYTLISGAATSPIVISSLESNTIYNIRITKNTDIGDFADDLEISTRPDVAQINNLQFMIWGSSQTSDGLSDWWTDTQYDRENVVSVLKYENTVPNVIGSFSAEWSERHWTTLNRSKTHYTTVPFVDYNKKMIIRVIRNGTSIYPGYYSVYDEGVIGYHTGMLITMWSLDFTHIINSVFWQSIVPLLLSDPGSYIKHSIKLVDYDYSKINGQITARLEYWDSGGNFVKYTAGAIPIVTQLYRFNGGDVIAKMSYTQWSNFYAYQ